MIERDVKKGFVCVTHKKSCVFVRVYTHLLLYKMFCNNVNASVNRYLVRVCAKKKNRSEKESETAPSRNELSKKEYCFVVIPSEKI